MILVGLMLVFFLVCGIGFAWNVIRGFRTGIVQAMYGEYDRSELSVQYWLCIIMYIIGTMICSFVAVFCFLWFAGMVQ